jgi:uncharacterized protein YfiM (DUF2279 family)
MNIVLPFVLAFRLSFGGPPPADSWFAEDKLKHFFMSFAVTELAYAGARGAGLQETPALATAAALAAGAGVWKEWRDRQAGGPFSHKDLVWDGLGMAAGLVLSAETR